MGNGWGGARPGSGRKRSDPNRPKPRLATQDGKRVLPGWDLNAIHEIIQASERHAKQVERTPERCPFQLAKHPPHAMPRSGTMAMDQALVSNLNWCATDWMAGGIMTANVGEALLFLGYPYLSELAQRPEYRTISQTVAEEATRKWIKFQATAEARRSENKAGKEKQQRKDEEEPDRIEPDRDHIEGAGDRSLTDEEVEEQLRGEEEDREQDEREQDEQAGEELSGEEEEKQEKANARKADRIKELNDEMERLELRDRFYETILLDNFFGRGHLYMNFGEDPDGDPEELVKPIGTGRDDLSKVKIAKGSFKGLKPIEPVWTYPMMYNATNPLAPNWYYPEHWYVMGRQIHRSRMPAFIARPVPDMLKPAYSFGGLSLSQLAKPYIDIWLRTRQSVADIVHSFSVMVLMTDLNTMLAPNSANQLFARVALFNALRDNNGTFVINKNTEDFKNVSASLAGLHELQAQAQEHCASVVRIPLVKYTGIQPSGLNADSEGVIRIWYDTMAGFQNTFRPMLTRVVNFMMLSLWGEVDEEIGFEFVPLWDMSDKERGDKQKADADRHQIYVDTGAISPEEVRKVIVDDPELPYTGLDPEDVPDLREEELSGLIPPGAGKGMEAVLSAGGEGQQQQGAPGGGGGKPGFPPKRPPPPFGAGGKHLKGDEADDATPKSFWTYRAATETPPPPPGWSQAEWEKFSPGMRREIARSLGRDAEFREADHPRAPGGRFGSKAGSHGGGEGEGGGKGEPAKLPKFSGNKKRWDAGKGRFVMKADEEVRGWLKQQGATERKASIRKDVKLPDGRVLKDRLLSDTVYDLPDGRTVVIRSASPSSNPAAPHSYEIWVEEAGEHFKKRTATASSLYKAPTKTTEQLVAEFPGGAEAIQKTLARIKEAKPTNGLVADGGFKQEDGTYTPERRKLHATILKAIFTPEAIARATPAEGEQATFVILGGRGGSGKSWVTEPERGGPVNPAKYIKLDADHLKAMLGNNAKGFDPGEAFDPSWRKYEGWDATLFHEESGDVLEVVQDYAISRGLNVILDGTLKLESATDRVAKFQDAGYAVDGYYVYAAPETAARRAMSRYRTKKGDFSGRFVPPEIIYGNTKNEQNFDKLSSRFRNWEVYDNDEEGIERPRRISGSSDE
jgi:phage-related protein (TIGR01555 family)